MQVVGVQWQTQVDSLPPGTQARGCAVPCTPAQRSWIEHVGGLAANVAAAGQARCARTFSCWWWGVLWHFERLVGVGTGCHWSCTVVSCNSPGVLKLGSTNHFMMDVIPTYSYHKDDNSYTELSFMADHTRWAVQTEQSLQINRWVRIYIESRIHSFNRTHLQSWRSTCLQ